MEKLTQSQKNILQVLKKLMADKGYPPTVREIGEMAHLSSPATIHFHLNKLAEKGYIEKGGGKNRTLRLLVDNEYEEKDESKEIESYENICLYKFGSLGFCKLNRVFSIVFQKGRFILS